MAFISIVMSATGPTYYIARIIMSIHLNILQITPKLEKCLKSSNIQISGSIHTGHAPKYKLSPFKLDRWKCTATTRALLRRLVTQKAPPFVQDRIQQKKLSRLCIAGPLCGIHLRLVNSRHKSLEMRKMYRCYDIIVYTWYTNRTPTYYSTVMICLCFLYFIMVLYKL